MTNDELVQLARDLAAIAASVTQKYREMEQMRKSSTKENKMKITIETIPHDKQRYDTVGDWQFDEENLNIKVSEIPTSGHGYYELLIGIHELVEAILCKNQGVTEQQVDDWDLTHGKDPGNNPECPYYRQHLLATVIENILANELGVDLIDYEISLNRLSK